MGKNKIGKPAFATGRYLKYALGEVILVVIGILIALQLSNLNEIKKDRDSERDYLLRIKLDINEDLAELKKHFKTDTLKLDSFTFLSRSLYSDTVKTSPELILNHFRIAMRLNWFEGKNIVFDDMKSAGKTSLIESDSLKLKTPLNREV